MDFEKYWGVHDVKSIESISHFENTNQVVNGLLQLFTEHEIHVTWASVGLLANSNQTLKDNPAHQVKIPYTNVGYSPFPLTTEKYGSSPSTLLSGTSEITAICNTQHQEFASHTYSHFYSCETGITANDFRKDAEQMNTVAAQYNTDFKSIVFPRNQVNTEHLAICKEFGMSSYRGNQKNRFWKNSSFEKESFFKKLGRVLDAYFPISKTASFSLNTLPSNKGLLNIPANRFLRPITGKSWLEKQKVKRIKKEMLEAARNGTVYHLWWHPHNFTFNVTKSLDQLAEILVYYKTLNQKFGFESLNMSEISDRAKK